METSALLVLERLIQSPGLKGVPCLYNIPQHLSATFMFRQSLSKEDFTS